VKNRIRFLFLLGCSNFLFAQNFYLKLKLQSEKEEQVIDSIGYQKQHSTPKSVTEQANRLSEQLSQIGYLQNRFTNPQKTNDSTFIFGVSLGTKTNFVKISTTKTPVLKQMKLVENDTFVLYFSQLDNFMNSVIQKLEVSGHSMSKIKLSNFSFKNNYLETDLTEDISQKRTLDDIVIVGYEKFPKGHRQQIKRMYRKRVFNQKTLEELHQDVQKIAFVNTIKAPEILFTQDTTRVFLYLEKAKANNFDGYVGFTTNENDKVVFLGYLDFLLQNALNSGEKMKLYWKNDGNDQQTFDFFTEIPHIFNSSFALRGNLSIFKQDSTFQTTKTNFDLGYYFRYNTRTYIGYNSMTSNDIQRINSLNLNDIESKFFTTTLEYFDLNRNDFLFPEQRILNLKFGVGSRKSTFENNRQFSVQLSGFNNFYLNEKNIINLKTENYYLNSNYYVINELYRFGGINSVRGFNENMLQASFLSAIMMEYRYVLAPSLYAHSITDFGYFQDKSTDINQKIVGFGFGLGLLTNNGLFNIVYANGNTDKQEIKLSNSVVHLSFKAKF